MLDLDKTNRVNMLIDFYSPLLTKKQLEYMERYFYCDLSLGEIALEFNISRNAVYDNIQRTIKQLENYEEKLQLIDKFNKRQNIYEQVKKQYDDEIILTFIKELENCE